MKFAFRKLNILSIDGGGSRGVMEAMILDDFTRLLTMMIYFPDHNLPTRIRSLNKIAQDHNKNHTSSGSSAEMGFRNALEIEDIEKCLIHPTKLFDMIVGTSTGSLMAFALVGGEKIPKKKEDEASSDSDDTMSTEDIIRMYQTATEKIFVTEGKGFWARKWKNLCSWISMDSWLRYFGDQPQIRSQNGLRDELDAVFKDTMLYQIAPCERNNFCIAAAVASEYNESASNPDKLEIFDTKNKDQKYFTIKNVALASSDAPVYFETPCKVGQKNYIDGGLTGNCPLAEALPRLLQIYDQNDPQIETVISIAPPSTCARKINDKLLWWLKYFATRLTDGYRIYVTSKNIYSKTHKTTFVRVTPISEKAQKFKMDETDVDAMIKAIELERISDTRYYNQILDICAITASRTLDGLGPADEVRPDFLKMMETVADDMIERRQYEICLRVCQNILSDSGVPHNNVQWCHFQHLIGVCKMNSKEYDDAYDELESAYDKISKLGESNLIDDEKIEILSNMGIVKRNTHDNSKAIELFNEALNTLNRNVLHPKYVELQCNVAISLQQYASMVGAQPKEQRKQRKRLKQSIDIFDECLKLLDERLMNSINDECQKKIQKVIANINNEKGVSYRKLGKHNKGLACCQNSLASQRKLCEQYENNENVAKTLSDIGRCYYRLKRYDLAIQNFEEALDMKYAFYDSRTRDDDLIAYIHHNLGLCKGKKNGNNLLTALYHANRGYQMSSRIFSETHPYVAKNIALLASISIKKGDFENALDYRRKHLYLQEQSHDAKNIVSSLGALGNVKLNKYRDCVHSRSEKLLSSAKDNLDEANKLASKLNRGELDDKTLAYIYDNLAFFFILNNDFDMALKYANKNYEIWQKFKKPSPGKARSKSRLAECYLMTLENDERAEENLKKVQQNLNDALEIINKYLGLSILRKKSRRLTEEDKDHELIAEILYNLGRCEMKMGGRKNLELALVHSQDSFEMKKRLSTSESSFLSRLKNFEFTNSDHPGVARIKSLIDNIKREQTQNV